MARKMISLLLILTMLCVSSALAYSYDFEFEPPFVGSIESTSRESVTGNRPYVDPDGSAAETVYFLSPTRHSSTTASNFIYRSSSSIGYFDYSGSYGGAGTSYCLSGYPSSIDFNAYTIGGSWAP